MQGSVGNDEKALSVGHKAVTHTVKSVNTLRISCRENSPWSPQSW